MESTNQHLSRFISHLGGKLRIDLTYVFHGGAWLTLGQIFSAFSALILSIAFARLVPKEIYGEYKFILSITGILGIFSLSGMGIAITRATGAGLDGTIFRVMKRVLAFNFILFPSSLVVAGYYFFNANIGVASALVIFGIASPIISSYGLFDSFLIGKKDFRASVIANATTSLVVAIGLISVMYFTKPTPLFLIEIYFGIQTFATLYFYHKTIKRYHPDSTKSDPETANYGAHLSVMGFFNTIADQIDKILIFHYLGAVQLAIYSFAVAIPEQIKGVLKNVTILMLPRFAERADDEILRTIWRKMFYFGLTAGIIVLSYILLAPTIFRILFPAYAESVYYSQIVTLSLLAVISNVPYAYIQTRMQKRLLYGFNISSAILQIALFTTLTPFYGLMGAIIAIVGSRAYSFVFWICYTIYLSTQNNIK